MALCVVRLRLRRLAASLAPGPLPLRLGPVFLAVLLTIRALLLGRSRRDRSAAPIDLSSAIAALLDDILAVIHASLPGRLRDGRSSRPRRRCTCRRRRAHAARTVVVVVVHGRADRDAGGEPDQAGGDRLVASSSSSWITTVVGACVYTTSVLYCGTYTTCGFVGSMTITSWPDDVFLVSTSCCGVLFSVPTLLRLRPQFLNAGEDGGAIGR